MTYEEAVYQLTNFEGTHETPSIEAIELAIKTLEKQIPKKPINKNKVNDGYFWEWVCPNCEVIQIGTEKPYCPECGQAMDWSD